MQTAKELKQLAYQDEQPDTAEPSEMCFWVRMRYIYKAYAAKLISRDTARIETTRAEQDFNIMRLWEQCYQKWTDRERAAEVAMNRYQSNPTEENKDKLLTVLAPELYSLRKGEPI